MTRPRHPYDLETPARHRGPRGGSTKPRGNYVRSQPGGGSYVKAADRQPPPIKLAYLAFLDTSNKPEHLK